MAFEWKHSSDGMDWDALSHLYRIAPLGEKKAADLKVVFSNSLFKSFVYEGGKLIGAGRALADGMDCSYICDIAVHPDYQGVGLGKEIVASLVGLSRSHKKIILYAVAGKEPFYRKLGFRRMLTAMAIFRNQEEAVRNGLLGDS